MINSNQVHGLRDIRTIGLSARRCIGNQWNGNCINNTRYHQYPCSKKFFRFVVHTYYVCTQQRLEPYTTACVFLCTCKRNAMKKNLLFDVCVRSSFDRGPKKVGRFFSQPPDSPFPLIIIYSYLLASFRGMANYEG